MKATDAPATAPAGNPRHPGLRGRPLLLAVCMGTSVAETVAVLAVGLESALGFAPHVTAPPPFGILHDVRFFLVYHGSWLAAAAQFVLMVAFRGALTALLVREAWPAGVARPSYRAIARRTVTVAAVAAVLLSPWAAFLFAVAITPVSYLFFAGLPTAILLGLLVHHAVVPGHSWRNWPPLRSVGWVLLSFLVLTLGAVILTATPLPTAIMAAAALGLFNAWAWMGIVSASATRDHRRRRVPLPAATVVVAVALVAALSYVGFSANSLSAELEREAERRPARGDAPVLVVAGYNSDWPGGGDVRFGDGYLARRFSYRGLGPDGRPLPYRSEDTRQDLGTLYRLMREQVAALHRDTGEPVAIAAESEGSLIAKLYVVLSPDPPVEEVITLSPLLRPGRVYFPPSGRNGQGVVTGWELRGLASAIGMISPEDFPADAPFVRSLLANAPLLRPIMGCQADGIEESSFFPLADAVVAPYVTTGDVDVAVVPAFHGGLLGNGTIRQLLVLELADEEIPRQLGIQIANLVIRGAASAWHVPTLPPGLNAAWADVPDPPENLESCEPLRLPLLRRLEP